MRVGRAGSFPLFGAARRMSQREEEGQTSKGREEDTRFTNGSRRITAFSLSRPVLLV